MIRMRKLSLQKSLGVIYILGAALCFALMNLFVRLSGDLPVMQKVFFRNIIATAVSFFILLRSEQKFRIQKGSLLFLFLRSLVGFLGVILNFYAIGKLNISDASILNKLAPFFAILFSLLLLKERPTAVEIVFVLITFGGAMFVVKPTFSWEAVPAFAGMLSGVCAGFAYTCVRILGQKGERSDMTVFFFSAFSTLVSLPFFIAFFKPMTWLEVLYLILAGASATGGQYFITLAYRKAPAKEIAVFDYAQVIFAALLGFFFLDQIPDVLSIIGYVVIIGTAVVKYVYQLKRNRSHSLLSAHTDAAPEHTGDSPPSQPNEQQTPKKD